MIKVDTASLLNNTAHEVYQHTQLEEITMNPDWQDFLTLHGTTIEAGVVQRFGDFAAELNATEQSTVLCDLSQFGTLRVSGDEAQSFLHMFALSRVRRAIPFRQSTILHCENQGLLLPIWSNSPKRPVGRGRLQRPRN